MSSLETYEYLGNEIDGFFTGDRLRGILENEAHHSDMRVSSSFPLEQRSEVLKMLGNAGFTPSELGIEENLCEHTLEVDFSARDFVQKDPETNLQVLRHHFLESKPTVKTDENVVNCAGEEIEPFSPAESEIDCTLQSLVRQFKDDNPDWLTNMRHGMGYLATNS